MPASVRSAVFQRLAPKTKLTDERFAATGLDHDFENNLLRFGFNYRF